MKSHAAITVNRPREEVQRLWTSPDFRLEHARDARAVVRFEDAPGDRGTEIHVELSDGRSSNRLGEVVGKITGAFPLAKVKDDLRRFKQQVETGEIARSDGAPEGELAERKFKQRPAQPLDESERQEVRA